MLSFSQAIFKIISFTVFLVLQMLCMAAALDAQSDSKDEIGEIVIRRLNVRDAAGTDARVIGILKKGQQVQIIGQENGWFIIRLKNKVGYIRAHERYVKQKTGSRKEELKGDSSSLEENLSQYQKEVDHIHQKIEAARTQVVTFTEKETEVINTLDELDFSLNSIRKHIRSLETELTLLEKQIKESEKNINGLVDKIKTTEIYASKRLVALYKLSWLGETQILASTESIYDIVRRQMALERILHHDEQLLKDLLQNKNDLLKELDIQNTHMQNKRKIEIDLNQQVEELSGKRNLRVTLLANIRSQKSLEMAAIDALNRSAADLNERISALSTAHTSPHETYKPEDLTEKPFSLLKGLLKMPVKGKIITKFGPYNNTEFNVMNFRSGIDIKADRGEPIRAVSSGKVLYASWFKGYGNMMIIDHGDNYYTVYAHIEELFKSQGDSVQKDEIVATVGDAGSRMGTKLYFEVRHHGKPLDPLHWLKKG